MCQVGNKSLPKPSNPSTGMHLFHVLKDRIGLHLVNHSFWDNTGLTPQNFTAVPEPWLFCGFTAILSLADVPEKSAECPAVEASLPMLTLYHPCHGPISLMWDGEQERCQVTIPRHLVGLCRSLWGSTFARTLMLITHIYIIHAKESFAALLI